MTEMQDIDSSVSGVTSARCRMASPEEYDNVEELEEYSSKDRMDKKKLMGVTSRRESSSMKQFIGDDDEDLSKSPDRTRSLNKIKKVKKFEKNQTAKNTVRG
mmetsp:Transcript_30579/g.40681  ORF Transcript_30579/g.40681 Transcript_30579/m.40681 type:complete len:102 (+) Transcript_30579:366-671(+)